ncbi:ATP-binding protein OS=Streptomyces microflavus OX=1919 GN=Smic_15350 PE=4 SV=1 [Streptomyces microflavus]
MNASYADLPEHERLAALTSVQDTFAAAGDLAAERLFAPGSWTPAGCAPELSAPAAGLSRACVRAVRGPHRPLLRTSGGAADGRPPRSVRGAGGREEVERRRGAGNRRITDVAQLAAMERLRKIGLSNCPQILFGHRSARTAGP